MKNLSETLCLADALVIDAARSPMCTPYTGKATSYTTGKPIDAFSSDAVWNGDGDGRQSEIMTTAANCVTKIKAAADQVFDHAPTLKALSYEMAKRSEDFHHHLHQHFNVDQKTLAALNLPEDDILLLFSDVFRLIVERWHTEYLGIPDVTADLDAVDRLTDLIWAAGKVHMIMQEFRDHKFKHHSIVQSAFVRFLTRKTGDNSSAGLATKIAALAKEVKAAATSATQAKRESGEALNKAKSTNDALDHYVKKNNLSK